MYLKYKDLVLMSISGERNLKKHHNDFSLATKTVITVVSSKISGVHIRAENMM